MEKMLLRPKEVSDLLGLSRGKVYLVNPFSFKEHA